MCLCVWANEINTYMLIRLLTQRQVAMVVVYIEGFDAFWQNEYLSEW